MAFVNDAKKTMTPDMQRDRDIVCAGAKQAQADAIAKNEGGVEALLVLKQVEQVKQIANEGAMVAQQSERAKQVALNKLIDVKEAEGIAKAKRLAQVSRDEQAKKGAKIAEDEAKKLAKACLDTEAGVSNKNKRKSDDMMVNFIAKPPTLAEYASKQLNKYESDEKREIVMSAIRNEEITFKHKFKNVDPSRLSKKSYDANKKYESIKKKYKAYKNKLKSFNMDNKRKVLTSDELEHDEVQELKEFFEVKTKVAQLKEEAIYYNGISDYWEYRTECRKFEREVLKNEIKNNGKKRMKSCIEDLDESSGEEEYDEGEESDGLGDTSSEEENEY